MVTAALLSPPLPRFTQPTATGGQACVSLQVTGLGQGCSTDSGLGPLPCFGQQDISKHGSEAERALCAELCAFPLAADPATAAQAAALASARGSGPCESQLTWPHPVRRDEPSQLLAFWITSKETITSSHLALGWFVTHK